MIRRVARLVADLTLGLVLGALLVGAWISFTGDRSAQAAGELTIQIKGDGDIYAATADGALDVTFTTNTQTVVRFIDVTHGADGEAWNLGYQVNVAVNPLDGPGTVLAGELVVTVGLGTVEGSPDCPASPTGVVFGPSAPGAFTGNLFAQPRATINAPTDEERLCFYLQLIDAPSTVANGNVTYTLTFTATHDELTATTPPLSGWTVDEAGYSETLTAAGGTPPYTWELTSGPLPAGLTLDGETGVISGTPTETGTFPITVTVTDDVLATDQQALSITINAAPSITTATLPDATVGAAYSETLAVAGGTSPFVWAEVGDNLGDLSLNPNTGGISGTPLSATTLVFTVTVTDAAGATTAGVELSIVVNAAPQITTTTLPNATVNQAYEQALAMTGGSGPFAWSVVSGSLGSDLTLHPSTGVISGTPLSDTDLSFTVRVTDNNDASDDQALIITVDP